MEPVALAVDKLKVLVKSSQVFVADLIQKTENSARCNPIEILKRLQREAFSDLMKLRDRQDKVERIISVYGSSKGSPFRQANTHVRGDIDILGAIQIMENVDQHNSETLNTAGIRTGIDSRLTFETIIRERDSLTTEFVASKKGEKYLNDVFGNPLSLSKVCYTTNVDDWFSLSAIPIGAQCRDIDSTNNSSELGKGLTNFSSFAPPMMTQHNGSAIGFSVRKSNIVASLAQFVSETPIHPKVDTCLSTFGKVVCHLSRGTKLSLLGLRQVHKSLNERVSLGAFTIPINISKRYQNHDLSFETFSPPTTGQQNTNGKATEDSFAVVLETEFDGSTRINGWIEMKQLNSKNMKWAITMCDTPANEVGWGLSMGGIVQEDSSKFDHFQVEGFLKLNIGERFYLQPGIVHVMGGNSQLPSLMLRSVWQL